MKTTPLLRRSLLCLLLLLPATAAFARFLAHVPPAEDRPVVPFTPQADNRPSDLRFLSFNVHHCEGTDTVLKPERVSWVIKQYMPHIVALQELDSVTTRTGGVDQLQVLAQANFMHPTYAATIPYQGGKYGIGILSQQKPLKTETLPLPGTEEPRLLLALWFPDFIFCCTHFSLTPQDRLAAAQLIAKKFEKADRPVFVAGDLNDVPGSKPLTALGRVFTPLTDVDLPTSPA